MSHMAAAERETVIRMYSSPARQSIGDSIPAEAQIEPTGA
jgi:hypothetical protein